MLNAKISPSLMCVNFKNLEQSIADLNKACPDYFHMDVMDGVFVPNITLSPDICKTIRPLTNIPFDYHFMICEPLNKIDWFPIQPNDLVCIHIEACTTTNNLYNNNNIYNREQIIDEFIEKVHKLGAKAGLAVSPDTRIEEVYLYCKKLDFIEVMTVYPGFAGQKLVEKCLPKIQALRKYLDDNSLFNIMIEVDGNVSFENAVRMRKLGADLFVGGSSSVFHKEDTTINNMKKMRESLSEVSSEY